MEKGDAPECIVFRPFDSLDKLPLLEHQLVALTNEQIDALCNGTPINGDVGVINVDVINGYVSLSMSSNNKCVWSQVGTPCKST